jgi:hypothetical protein
MSRKFIGRKELALVNAINREVIRDIVGQQVYYYEILADQTAADDLYHEAVQKTYKPPVRVSALVNYENSQEAVTDFPPDMKFKVEVYIAKQELEELSLEPKMGDFVQFGQVMYEVYQTTQPQMLFGMIEEKAMTQLVCGPARKGQFDPKKQPDQRAKEDSNAPKYPRKGK